MITRKDFQKIAELRLKEAKTLYKAGLYDGTVYLCGYAVEAALKARICRHLQMKEYLDSGDMKGIFLSHDFDRLLLLSGLSNKINLANKKNAKLFQHWSILTSWTPEARYFPVGTSDKKYAKNMLYALEHKSDGFLVWIKRIW